MLAVMAVWGSTFVATKATVVQIPPLALSFIRVSIGALVLLPLALYRRRRQVSGKPLPWRATALLSLIGVAVYYLAFNLSLSYTSASQGALVQSCVPAVTALAAVVLLRERASRTRIVGMVLSMLGVLIVFSSAAIGSAPANLLGNALMFIAVLAWGAYTALAKRLTDYDPVLITTGIMGIGAMMLLPFAVVELHGLRLAAIGIGAWYGVFYLGAVASAAAYLAYNYSLRHMEAGQAGVFGNLIPVVGVISGVVVLHEPVSLPAILGGLVVMLGVWITGTERPAAVSVHGAQ